MPVIYIDHSINYWGKHEWAQSLGMRLEWAPHYNHSPWKWCLSVCAPGTVNISCMPAQYSYRALRVTMWTALCCCGSRHSFYAEHYGHRLIVPCALESSVESLSCTISGPMAMYALTHRLTVFCIHLVILLVKIVLVDLYLKHSTAREHFWDVVWNFGRT